MANELTGIQKFKKILEYFVAHLTYLAWRDRENTDNEPDSTNAATITGFNEYIKPHFDKKDEGWRTGSGHLTHREIPQKRAIQDCIAAWCEFNYGSQNDYICINVQLGEQGGIKKLYSPSCYLNWCNFEICKTGDVNIVAVWDDKNENIKSLKTTTNQNVSIEIEDKEYPIADLGLYNSGETEKLKQLFVDYRNKREMEIKGSFLSQTCIDILHKNYNLILSGAPGTGKTWLAYDIASHLCHGKAYSELDETEKKQIGFVQFHPSYDYTDFVEGLRPDPDTTTDGNVGFKRNNGVFKEFCKDAEKYSIAKNHEQKPFVFIIDEINRGELSKIFGELFFCIDKGYRGDKHKVLTQYQNLVDADDVFANGFYIPENVYIIGTMNDIDRSVETMDFAMRRRFTFKEILASDRLAMLDDALEDDVKEVAIKTLSVLNKQIEKTLKLSSAYHVGPAYFLDLKKERYDGDFDMLWSYNIKPLLQEYMRGKNGAAEMIAKVHEEYTKASRSDISDIED